MPLLLVPVLIILGIFAFGARDAIFKTLDVLPDLGWSTERSVQQQQTPRQTALKQTPPESPPPAPTPKSGAELYGDWIEISSVRKQDPYLITLRTSIPQGNTLTLTGWSLESREETFTIPQGIELVPQGLQGAVFAPIVLQRGDSVKISGASNPFKPKFSFKPNECFGYLKERVDFPVSVSSSCPDDRPKVQDVSHLTPACQDFILDFNRCKEPPVYPQTPTFANDLQCRTYHENLEFQLSYEGCVRNHKTEDGFFDKEWHIYVDEEDRLIRASRDRIQLKDPQGALIDEFVY